MTDLRTGSEDLECSDQCHKTPSDTAKMPDILD